MLIEKAKEYGFKHYINLVFRKNYSAQVLKSNMKIVGNCEYAMLFYRDKLPKFRNDGKMIFNCVDIPENYCFDYERDKETPKIHPTQKSIQVIQNLISIFTDVGDIVIDPCAGSGVTLLAAESLGRKSYGFEIKKEYVTGFKEKLADNVQVSFLQLNAAEKVINQMKMQGA
jgi:site-specific DNA-methyltransferase (adenine-specific)